MGSFVGVGTDDNNASGRGIFRDHFFAGKQRLIRNTTEHFYNRGSTAQQEQFALSHGTVKCNTENFQVYIVHCIYNDLLKTIHRQKLLFDGIQIQAAQIIQRDADNIGCGKGPFCFFFNIIW